jgi:hypothetical protein
LARIAGDLDDDGDPDILLVTHDTRYTGNLLYRNDGGRFTDVAGTATDAQSSAPLQSRIDGHGSMFVDLDLDGDLDVVLSGFRLPPHVYVNESVSGALAFRRACDGLGIAADELLTWGLASADLTGDGYPRSTSRTGSASSRATTSSSRTPAQPRTTGSRSMPSAARPIRRRSARRSRSVPLRARSHAGSGGGRRSTRRAITPSSSGSGTRRWPT